MATYDKGDQVRVTATFTSANVNADPTNEVAGVSVQHRQPSGNVSPDPTPVRTGVGVYYVDVNLDEVGLHAVKFTGTEGVLAAKVIELEVAKSVFDF
jgi:hypothetical protein